MKIIDLAAGDQPIKSDDGDTVIVFNGEIYNHAELRVELEKLGHRFHSRADTETVLHAFIEWDTACFSRLRGMFAVALWTESSQRLVLARDRMGIKPLYFTRRGNYIFFGSELKAILIHPEIDRRLSMEGLDCYLSLNYVPCPWTLVEGIEKLPPGHWLEWRNGEIRSEAYWTLPFVTPRQRTFESAKEGWIICYGKRCASTSCPMFRSACGSAGESIHPPSCTTPRLSSSRLKTLSISFPQRPQFRRKQAISPYAALVQRSTVPIMSNLILTPRRTWLVRLKN